MPEKLTGDPIKEHEKKLGKPIKEWTDFDFDELMRAQPVDAVMNDPKVVWNILRRVHEDA